MGMRPPRAGIEPRTSCPAAKRHSHRANAADWETKVWTFKLRQSALRHLHLPSRLLPGVCNTPGLLDLKFPFSVSLPRPVHSIVKRCRKWAFCKRRARLLPQRRTSLYRGANGARRYIYVYPGPRHTTLFALHRHSSSVSFFFFTHTDL